MDGSAFRHLNLGWLFWWAVIGMVLAGLVAGVAVSAAGWWLFHHVILI